MIPFPKAAYEVLTERVNWIAARTPGLSGEFAAVVLHGEGMSSSAGPSNASYPGDDWRMVVEDDVALVAEFREGDRIELIERRPQTMLTVQQITRDATGWTVRCTAKTRVK